MEVQEINSGTPVFDLVIERARDHLAGLQRPDGSWQAYNLFGPVETAQVLIFEQRYGVLDPSDASESIRWLRTQQLADGSFPPYPKAPYGDLSTTCYMLAAFRAGGVSPADPAYQLAAGYVESNGGFAASRLDARLFLHLAGLVPVEDLPEGLLFHKLVPGIEDLMIRFLGSWMVMAANLVPAVLTVLKRHPSAMKSPFRRLAVRRVEEYLWPRQHESGDWFGILSFTLLALIFLLESGTPLQDPRIQAAVKWLGRLKRRTPEGMWVVQLTTEIWDTAWAGRALVESGVPPTDPTIKRAVDYLLSQQAKRPAPRDWQNTPKHAPRTGGWGWGEGDVLVPDCDDTGFVVLFLALARDADARAQPAAAEAIAWLFGMQNDSGGWPVHCHGHATKKPGALPFNSLYRRVIDTASEEITGRLLSALAKHGYTADDPRVARAIEFLREQVDSNGAWWGGWTLNYLASTASVLSGLRDVGFDMNDPMVRRAVAWIKARQNSDGGFGESIASYQDRRFAGVGRSRPSLTGFVLYGLLDAGEVASSTVEAAIAYLQRTQLADGSWEDDDVQNALSPYDDRYYFNAFMSKYFPLLALCKYRGSSAQALKRAG